MSAAEIQFARDYGHPPVAPFFLVWNECGHWPRHKHETKELAEAEAARLAGENPGTSFHVLGVMATIMTSTDIIGQRFDPARHKPQPVIAEPDPPEFAEVEEAPVTRTDEMIATIDRAIAHIDGDDHPF